MNFSKKTDYTLRILSHIANDTDKTYQADELHRKLDIPYRYLRKLLTELSKGDLLNSIQGKAGGFQIAKNPQSIYLIDIVKATGDPIVEQKCFFGYKECALNNPCAMHNKWDTITKNLISVLVSTNLAELITKQQTI